MDKTKEITSRSGFLAGAVSVDITPQLPAALVGQYYCRVAHEVYSPLTANILTMASDGQSVTFVACDQMGVPKRFVKEAREALAVKRPGFPVESVIFTATHTHTAPFLSEDTNSENWGAEFGWKRHEEDEITPDEYRAFAVERVVDGILAAWDAREPARVATGIGHASIGYCRRTVYRDGTAVMYGNTNSPDFLRMEDAGDDGLHFATIERRRDGALMAAMIEVACPAQVLEHHDYIAADYWHEVRRRLRAAYGEQTVVVGLCGAAGDLSPRDLVRTAMPEPAMHKTAMYQPEGTVRIAEELSRRFADFMQSRRPSENVPLRWAKRWLSLPLRTVTKEECDRADAVWKRYRALHEDMRDFTEMEAYAMSIEAGIRLRYEEQQRTRTHTLEIHAIRLGDMLIAANPFELYVEYADRMRSRRGGGKVMIVQLANDYMGYLPSAPAIAHGGYSALVCNGHFGADGGDLLVEETLGLMEEVWPVSENENATSAEI